MDVIVGMGVLAHHCVAIDRGKLSISAAAHSRSGNHKISGKGFEVEFDGSKWTARWEWTAEPDVRKRVAMYAIPPNMKKKFDDGVKRWITEDFLVPLEGEAEDDTGLIPLMLVEQLTKGKSRPVLDYREVNRYVTSSGAGADICAEKLREWRMMPEDCAIIDLTDAYMQIRAHSHL